MLGPGVPICDDPFDGFSYDGILRGCHNCGEAAGLCLRFCPCRGFLPELLIGGGEIGRTLLDSLFEFGLGFSQGILRPVMLGDFVAQPQRLRLGPLFGDPHVLGHDDAERLLQQTLEEEKETDEKLTELGESEINIMAASGSHD